MAEEASNIQEQATAAATPVAAPTPQPTKTETTFAEYEANLIAVDVPAGHNALKTSLIDDRSKRATRRNKRCFLIKASETVRFYQRINDHISVFAKQEADEIKANVTDYTNLSANLGTLLGAALAATTAAKAKILIAKDKAIKMDEARKNSAFSDAIAEMDKAYAPDGPKGGFGKAIEAIKGRAENCLNTADDAVEVAVKVIGIGAGANVGILSTMGNQLSEKAGSIHQDVGSNITDASAKQTAAQREYNDALKNISISKYNKYEKTLGYAAVLDTTSEVHRLDCINKDRNWIKHELERLAKAIESNFIETNPPAAPATPATAS